MAVNRMSCCSSQILNRLQSSFNKFVSNNRTITSENENRQKTNIIEITSKTSSEWERVYNFQFIKGLVGLNRLKYYQAAITAIAVPISLAIPEVADPVYFGYIGVSGIVTLSLASYAFRNTVGFIYTNQSQPEDVKFAYLDFWGRRQDVVLKIEDVTPLSEIPKSIFNPLFTNLQFYNKHPKLKLVYKHGGIDNFDEFSRVFGMEKFN